MYISWHITTGSELAILQEAGHFVRTANQVLSNEGAKPLLHLLISIYPYIIK